MMTKKKEKMVPVMVTTEFRGVFFGYVTENEYKKKNNEKITLKNARNCIKWESSSMGVFGLAANGPNEECRVSPQVEEKTVFKITSISKVSNKAAKEWEKGFWA